MTKPPRSGGYAGERGNVGDGYRHLVDFSCHIKRDIVVWDELAKDGITLDRCRFKPGKKKSRVRLSGAKLDVSDFEAGVIFVIEKGDYEVACGKPLNSVPGIDDSDNILFYKILRRRVINRRTVILSLKLLPGRYVVPIVDVNIRKQRAPPMDEDFYMMDSGTSARVIDPVAGNNTLPTSERISRSFSRTIVVAAGVTFNVAAGVDVSFTSFRVVRLLQLEFRWQQSVDAFVRGSLNVNLAYRNTLSGEIGQAFIPGLSFGIGIPLVGKLEAGAFIGLDWVVDLEATVQGTLTFDARYRRLEEVTASLLPPSYNAVNKLPSGSGASSTASLTLAASAAARFQGFGGIRPFIGVRLEYTRTRIRIFPPRIDRETRSIDGSIGSDIGLQLTALVMIPPFPPFPGKSLNSICNNCHNIRANLRFVGKRLSAQLRSGGRVTSERVLVASLFDLDIGTLCFLPQTCPIVRALHG